MDFPIDINRDEEVFNPKIQEIKIFLSNSDYYEIYKGDNDAEEEPTPKGEFAEEVEEEGIEFSVDNYMKNLRVNCEEDFVSNDEDDGETEYDEEDIEEIKHEELPSDISDKKKISSSSIMKSKIKGIFTK